MFPCCAPFPYNVLLQHARKNDDVIMRREYSLLTRQSVLTSWKSIMSTTAIMMTPASAACGM